MGADNGGGATSYGVLVLMSGKLRGEVKCVLGVAVCPPDGQVPGRIGGARHIQPLFFCMTGDHAHRLWREGAVMFATWPGEVVKVSPVRRRVRAVDASFGAVVLSSCRQCAMPGGRGGGHGPIFFILSHSHS